MRRECDSFISVSCDNIYILTILKSNNRTFASAAQNHSLTRGVPKDPTWVFYPPHDTVGFHHFYDPSEAVANVREFIGNAIDDVEQHPEEHRIPPYPGYHFLRDNKQLKLQSTDEPFSYGIIKLLLERLRDFAESWAGSERGMKSMSIVAVFGMAQITLNGDVWFGRIDPDSASNTRNRTILA